MKRLTLFISVLVLTITQMVAQDTQENSIITLRHQGSETNFAYNKMQDAINAAIDGDTIFLSAGDFEGDVVVDKRLAFIGVGEYKEDENSYSYLKSNYSGRFVFDLPEDTKLSAKLFEGVYFHNNTFTFSKSIENVIFKKCQISVCNFTIEKSMKSILFDRCSMFTVDFPNKSPLKVIARNCYMHNTKLQGESVICSHCNIIPVTYIHQDEDGNKSHRGNIETGEYDNCIISNVYDGNTYPLYEGTNSSASYTNCLLYNIDDNVDIFGGATNKDCMFSDFDNYQNNILYLTLEELQAKNYLGNDGTVVGNKGGKNPYSLKITKPVVSTSKIHFDKDKNQVQFKLKVSSKE